MTHDPLEGLAEPFAAKARALVERIERLGLPLVPFEGRRLFSRSAKLYMEGRAVVNGVITVVDKSKVVSNARSGSSAHNWGLGLDCILVVDHPYFVNDVRPTGPWDDGMLNGVVVRPAIVQSWTQYGRAVRDSGLIWGGDWHGFKDRPHAELPRWEQYRPANWKDIAAREVMAGR